MNYNILDFIKEFHPEVSEEFYRYKRKDVLPAIGTEVKTLVSGYGGYAGVTRYVVGYEGDRYIELAYTPNGRASSLCEIADWWKELKIINEPEAN